MTDSIPLDQQAQLILAPRQAVADDVADRMREAIILGEFEPNTNLREVDLAERFEVSRGPIREALKRLEREGLVVSRRNHGAVVCRAHHRRYRRSV